MRPDEEGFPQPHIELSLCADCGLCRHLCPVNSKEVDRNTEDLNEDVKKPLEVYAAWHLDETIRQESSSGGVFTALAESILAQGGVVVGAAFDEHLVVRHMAVDRSADLHRLRGSKYVQSQISPALYRQIRDLLQQRRPVLFSGVPCEVAGLRAFLARRYDDLYCCDLVCHGVPSPYFFARYVRYYTQNGNHLVGLSFRDKTTGWKNYSIRQHMKDGHSRLFAIFADPYMIAFLRNYALRRACYTCKFASTIRTGDLTLGDFWGVGKEYPDYDRDDEGTSLVLVNSRKGHTWLDICQSSLFLGQANLNASIVDNPTLVHPTSSSPQRNTFYLDLNTMSFAEFVREHHLYPPSVACCIMAAVKRWLLAICRRAYAVLRFVEGEAP